MTRMSVCLEVELGYLSYTLHRVKPWYNANLGVWNLDWSNKLCGLEAKEIASSIVASFFNEIWRGLYFSEETEFGFEEESAYFLPCLLWGWYMLG